MRTICLILIVIGLAAAISCPNNNYCFGDTSCCADDPSCDSCGCGKADYHCCPDIGEECCCDTADGCCGIPSGLCCDGPDNLCVSCDPSSDPIFGGCTLGTDGYANQCCDKSDFNAQSGTCIQFPLVMHAFPDSNHCNQITVAGPSSCFYSFWAAHGYQYKSFDHGPCPSKFNDVTEKDLICGGTTGEPMVRTEVLGIA